MSRVERIGDRLPRFYKIWDQNSFISLIVKSVSLQLDEAESRITDLMQGHWVDTAKDEELDKLGLLVGSRRTPNEESEHLRGRLKRAVDEYKGGGTVPVILEAVKKLLNAVDSGIEIAENPLVKTHAELRVVANDTWTLGSNSIRDEQPSVSLAVEEEGEVSNPRITNMDTGESILFKGKLKTGEKLVLNGDTALLGEEDVGDKVAPRGVPMLLRKSSTWKYSEELLEKIGVFDSGKFDEHTFAVGVPTVKVRFEWTKRQPATFIIQIPRTALYGSGVDEYYLEQVAASMKAAGTSALIKIKE
jgi:hypothetical protein